MQTIYYLYSYLFKKFVAKVEGKNMVLEFHFSFQNLFRDRGTWIMWVNVEIVSKHVTIDLRIIKSVQIVM